MLLGCQYFASDDAYEIMLKGQNNLWIGLKATLGPKELFERTTGKKNIMTTRFMASGLIL